MNETGCKIKEQYADTGGFTDLVFAVTALLAYRFIPRIRDLPSKRLHLFDPESAPAELRGLIGGKIRERLIVDNWPDILRAGHDGRRRHATEPVRFLPPSARIGTCPSRNRRGCGRCSSLNGCSMPICSAVPRSASTRVRLTTR